MRGTDFRGSNVVMNAPSGMDDIVYPLPALRTDHGFTTVWELEPGELDHIMATGLVAVHVMGQALPPMSLQVVRRGEEEKT